MSNLFNSASTQVQRLFVALALLFAAVVVACCILPAHAYADVVSGECGATDSNVVWAYDTDSGVLTIAGDGAIKNYDAAKLAPWYSYRKNMTSIIIGEGVTRIGDRALSETAATSIVLPTTLKTIGSRALRASSIKALYLPEGFTRLSERALENCEQLARVDIPSTIRFLGVSTFINCEQLQTVNIADMTSYIKAFSDSEMDEHAMSPLYYGASLYLKGQLVEDVVISSEIKYLVGAFQGCSSLKSVKIPSSVVSIGSSVFNGCSNLSLVEIEPGCTSIGSWAFYKCTNLKEIIIPEGVTTIGYAAFGYIENLRVSLPLSLKSTNKSIGWDERDSTTYVTTLNPGSPTIYYAGDPTQRAAVFGLGSDYDEDKGVTWNYLHTHTWIQNVAHDPSCTKLGYTTSLCNCGESWNRALVEQTAHALGDPEVHEPTCAKQGYTSVSCTVCNYVEKSNYVPRVAHIQGSVVTLQQATCSERGYLVAKCTQCKKNYGQILGILDHEYAEIVTEPTCTENGYTTHTCTYCQGSFKDTYVAPLGHDAQNVEAKEATCAAPGCSEGLRCTRCGQWFGGESYFLLPHSFVEDASGNLRCSGCNALKGDVNSNGVVNIIDAQLAYDIATKAMKDTTSDQALCMRAAADVVSATGDVFGTVDAQDAYAIQMAVLRGWKR